MLNFVRSPAVMSIQSWLMSLKTLSLSDSGETLCMGGTVEVFLGGEKKPAARGPAGSGRR
jgi:hypothetical protein